MTGQDEDINALVDAADSDLRAIEESLEHVGAKICCIKGSATSHGCVNLALNNVREAIRGLYLMYQ